MGIVINAEIETNQGPTDSLYFRIDSWKINKTVGDITFTTTSWLNQEYGDKFLRNYYDEPLRAAIGLVSSRLIVYKDTDPSGEELNIDNLYKVPMYEELEVEEPIFTTEETSREVPYTSFDENGDEITLYKTVTQKQKVQSGTNKVIKKVMNYSLVNNLEEFCYAHLEKELKKYFPEGSITKL